MCEIFPEVDKCCVIFSLRVGMLFISVLAIMTGVITMSVLEKTSDANYNNLKNVTNFNSSVLNPKKAMSALNVLIPSGVVAISLIFMFTGFILLFSTITDSEGLTQIFVWVTFLAVMIGYVLVLLTGLECATQSHCILQQMDWLSMSAVLLIIVCYLSLWIYFISVANSSVIA